MPQEDKEYPPLLPFPPERAGSDASAGVSHAAVPRFTAAPVADKRAVATAGSHEAQGAVNHRLVSCLATAARSGTVTQKGFGIKPRLPPSFLPSWVGLEKRRYVLTCGHPGRGRACPPQAVTPMRQARGRQEFSFIWHSELYNTFTENHTFESMYTLFPLPPLLATHVTGNNPLHPLGLLKRGTLEDRCGGIACSPHHPQSNGRNNLLALLKAVTALFPPPHRNAVTALASLTRLFGPLEHGSVAITSMYNRYLLPPYASSASNAFFSLPFYNMQ